MSPTKKKTPAPKKATAKKAAAKPVKNAKTEKAPARKPAAKPAPAPAPKKPAAASAASKEAARKPEKATKPDKAAKPEKVEKAKIEKVEKQEKSAEKVSAKAAESGAKVGAKGAKAAEVRPPAKVEAPAKGKPATAKKGEDEVAGASKRSKPKKPVVPTGPRHPKLGFRWGCFRCAAKFYDLGKEEPICPKCGADQRDRPADEPRAPSAESSRPRVVRPMAQLLDDDEPVAPMVEDDLGLDDVVEAGDMFEGDGDITHLELDAAELEGETIEAGESDEF